MEVQTLTIDEIFDGAVERASTPAAAIKIVRETLANHGYRIVHLEPGQRLQKVCDVATASEKARAG